MKNNREKVAYFTIDVERFIDTECVYKAKQPVSKTMLDGLDRYMQILDKYGIKATLFVLSDLVDEVKEKLIKHIKNGHKIALHGKRHVPPVMMENEYFEEQIKHAKEKVERALDVSVVGFRAPCFGIDREKINILEKMGFRYDASMLDFSSATHHTNIDLDGFEKIGSETFRKGNFFEFGLSMQKVFGKKFPVSGGGYIRLSNWFFAKTMLNKRFRTKDNYVFYLHPFEMSKEKIPWIKNMKIYDYYYLRKGMHTYPKKIEHIIKKLKKYGFKFKTFEDALND